MSRCKWVLQGTLTGVIQVKVLALIYSAQQLLAGKIIAGDVNIMGIITPAYGAVINPGISLVVKGLWANHLQTLNAWSQFVNRIKY